MKSIQKIDDEMVEILNLIQNENFNDCSKKIIIQKIKKMIFDFRVLKEILDENEFFSVIHDKNLQKINSNYSSTLNKQNLNIFNNIIDFQKKNLCISSLHNNNIEFEVENEEEQLNEKINLIPKSISNSSLTDFDKNKKNE